MHALEVATCTLFIIHDVKLIRTASHVHKYCYWVLQDIRIEGSYITGMHLRTLLWASQGLSCI